MNDHKHLFPPAAIERIEAETQKLGFEMGSDHQTGSLLRTLASTKPGGRLLELGTGTGLSAAWMLDGMDANARLTTVDTDERAVAIAKAELGDDPRVNFRVQDGSELLKSLEGQLFDIVFADTWPGKIWDLDLALNLLAPGGMYVVDDMTYQSHWPKEHLPKVERLIEDLEKRDNFIQTKLSWSTGIMIVTRKDL